MAARAVPDRRDAAGADGQVREQVDPGSPDWQAVVDALPGLLGQDDGAELGDGS